MDPSPRAGAWPRDRLLLYGSVILLGYVASLIYAAVLGVWLVGPDGLPIPTDFVSFWAAGRLGLEGQAAAAYDWALHRAVQLAALGQEFEGNFPWHNPPLALMLVTPFALAPYPVAWVAWILVTAGLFTLALRLVVPGHVLPAALAAPASLWCAMVGQNGFLTAALMLAALGLLERRPWLAGVFLGLLTYKPQFGVLFPLFLLAGRRWRTFAAAAATTLILAAAATLLFGTGIWPAFVASVRGSGEVLARGGAAWEKLQSVYAIAFQLTASLPAAMSAQLATAALVLAALAWQWTRPTPPDCRAAALVAASWLVTPYAYIYDAVVLTAAAAFLLRDGATRGFARGERWAVLLGVVLPGTFPVLGSPAAPAGALVLLAVALRRSRAPRAGLSRPEAAPGA